MKKLNIPYDRLRGAFLLLAGQTLLMSFLSLTALAEQLFVESKAARLRQEPKHWAKSVAELSYGDSLQLIERQSGWNKVQTNDGLSGFVHSSAVTSRKVVISATDASDMSGADQSDIVLAGKGFNEEVELAFRSGGELEADYEKLELVLANQNVTEDQLSNFIQTGGLNDE